MIYVGEGRAWKSRSFRTPRIPLDAARKKGHSSSFNRGARCISVCTRYEFRCHPTLAVDFVHASSPILEIREKTWARSFYAAGSNRPVFFFSLITIVPSVDFRKSITMATVGDDKLRDSSRPFSCSDFLREANRYKLVDVYNS